MTIIKAIRDQLTEIIDSLETTEEKKLKLIAIDNFIDNKPPPLEEPQHTAAVKDIKPPLHDEKKGEIDPKPCIDVSQMFRRDFGIKGQIGSPGEGNQLSFINLARQIESAVSKGYKESEIVESVIQAICPGTPLRSYLESTPALI